ncbi:MAG TPA: pyridoxal phosphate-dependent aminotransferase [Opitutaceae bacterium]|nr:pyridoxal phosphate-dependent aminotransferase [Opitutaceae bacterium]
MRESHRISAVQSPIIPVIADLIRACPGTISLGQGVVNYGPPPAAHEQIARFLADPANHKYQPVAGIPALVAAIQTKLAAENGVPIDAGSRVLVTAGGNMAFMNAVLALTDPGDEIILPTPYYFNQEMAVTMANARAVLVPTDKNYQLDVDALRAAITPRTRAIVTVSPNNPTGAVYPESTLRAVNRLCADRGVFHIHDEAYEYFTYGAARAFSPASVPGSAAHTISLYSLSKSHGFASWRIGWMIIPAQLEAAVRKIQDTLLICPPVISQYAAIGALQAGRGYVEDKLRALGEMRLDVQRALGSIDRCEVPPADGAFYFLLRVATQHPPMALAERLIREHGVAVIPGNAFGLEQGCHLRVAYAALPRAAILEGIERLVRGLQAIA